MIILKNQAAANVDYALYRTVGDRSTYSGPLKTDIYADTLVITSTAPKKSRTSNGNRRSSVNLLTSTSVAHPSDGGMIDLNRKLELVGSYPVGTTDEQFMEDISRLRSLSDSEFLAIFKTGKIEF